MAVKIKGYFKLLLKAGEAMPGGKLAAAFGSNGVAQALKPFCDKFNAETQARKGQFVPAVISIYEDKTTSYVLKKEPVAKTILRILNVEKGSSRPNQIKIGTLTKEQVKDIAKNKIDDLNAHGIEEAENIVAGTARSMGVDVLA